MKYNQFTSLVSGKPRNQDIKDTWSPFYRWFHIFPADINLCFIVGCIHIIDTVVLSY